MFLDLRHSLVTYSIIGLILVTNSAKCMCLKPTLKNTTKQYTKAISAVIKFNPRIKTIATIPGTDSIKELKKEIPLYSATPEFVQKHGGNISKEITAKIPQWYYQQAQEQGLFPTIDIRTLTITKDVIPEGYRVYPAIPGWHADGFFRETYFSQPNPHETSNNPHIVATVSSHPRGVSNTEFLLTPVELATATIGTQHPFWLYLDQQVNNLEQKKCTSIKDGAITLFDTYSLHRAMPIKEYGMRLFFRISMLPRPTLGDGQLSKHEQIYLLRTDNNLPEEQFAMDQSIGSLITTKIQPTAPIGILAQEEDIIGATTDYMIKNGSSFTLNIIQKLSPIIYALSHKCGLHPIFDIQSFRLNKGHRPFIVDYTGKPKSVDWHIDTTPDSRETPELWVSISSHKEGVNCTEFLDGSLSDGEVLLTSSKMPRRERAGYNRGWRYIMRIRFTEHHTTPTKKQLQQYVEIPSESSSW